MESKVFTNWSTTTFTHSWDKQDYTFKAGESKRLPGFLADHLAKHLANRELQAHPDPKFTTYTGNPRNPYFQEFVEKALSGSISAPTELAAEIATLNEDETDEPVEQKAEQAKPAKPTKTIKAKPSKASKIDEEEFEGLKEE